MKPVTVIECHVSWKSGAIGGPDIKLSETNFMLLFWYFCNSKFSQNTAVFNAKKFSSEIESWNKYKTKGFQDRIPRDFKDMFSNNESFL